MALFLRHTGIYVANIERMIAFYSKVFGLKPVYRQIEAGPVSDEMFGVEGVKIDVCKLSSQDGSMLELIQSIDIDGDNTCQREIRKEGQLHIAYTVKDAHAIYETVISEGGECMSKPILSANGAVYVFFAKDPEGNFMEIVEELK